MTSLNGVNENPVFGDTLRSSQLSRQMSDNITNGMECGDITHEDCRPLHSIEKKDGFHPISEDNRSNTSSKSSIKSNVSEERNSMGRHKKVRNSDSIQMRVLPTKDRYCWDCHKQRVDYSCKTCLRSYHKKCPSLKKCATERQSCPECIGIMKAEEGTNPSGCMQWLNGNVDRMAELLNYTIITVKHADKNQSFHKPVSTKDYPQYPQFVVNPMDLSLIEDNIKNKTYASTNSFLADIKWIFHNCYVFNSGDNNALISEAKNIIRVAKQECEEIEICPDCYLNYYTLDEETYFAAVCDKPHAIVWAKLKGHPYWPAKIVRYNELKDEVDVRFFGTHDKCWLKPHDCLLMSQNFPTNKKPAKFDQGKFDDAIRDMNLHLDQLSHKFKNLFRFYEERVPFTVDRLYLSRDPNPVPVRDDQTSNEQNENPKVVNIYNGIAFKSLKVKANKFDINSHIIRQNDSSELRSPTKRLNKCSLKGSPKSKKRCYSTAMSTREELSSLESDQSMNESRDHKMERSFSSNTSFERKTNSKNHLTEKRLNSSNGEPNESNRSLKVTPILSHSQTVTVSGKSTEILNLNNLNSKSINDSTENSNRLLIDIDMDSVQERGLSPQPQPKPKSTQSKTVSTEELMKKNKSLEFKNRKLEEDLEEANNRITAMAEEMDELKKSNDELQTSIIPDIKRKQWCSNCSKEGILPCCWNTCYCTVECQHQHWPIHSKICRRRQQSR